MLPNYAAIVKVNRPALFTGLPLGTAARSPYGDVKRDRCDDERVPGTESRDVYWLTGRPSCPAAPSLPICLHAYAGLIIESTSPPDSGPRL